MTFFDLIASSISETVLLLLLVYIVYLSLSRIIFAQNILLLLLGYAIYALIDVRHLFVLVAITVVTFGSGLMLPKASNPTLVLRLSIAALVGTLVGFRYYVVIVSAFESIFAQGNPVTLEQLVPLGISFYVLQAISYLVDINSSRHNPEKNFVNLALYLSLIFKLPAGPIERPEPFLQQIRNRRQITGERINVGATLIIQGLFEKFVIADNLALIVNGVFSSPDGQGLNIPLAVVAFAVQLYADFSGYSNMFRGLAMFFGFELSLNFKLPYFANSPNDFWARWHVSLSNWLREYVFFPLRRWLVSTGRTSTVSVIVPTVAAMLVSGLWHGATVNFVVWGLYWAGLSIAFYYLDKRKQNTSKTLIGSAGLILRIGLMFLLICIGWFFFRAEGLTNLIELLGNVSLQPTGQTYGYVADLVFYAGPLLLLNLIQAYKQDLLVLSNIRMPLRAAVWAILVVWILIFGAPAGAQFIYARF